MKWIKTEEGEYANLDLAYHIYIKQIPSGKDGCGEFKWGIIADFLIEEKDGEVNSVCIALLNDKLRAQEYLDKLNLK